MSDTEKHELRRRPLVGCFPLYPPLELIHSMGLNPVVLWGLTDEGPMPDADLHVQAYACQTARRMMQRVLAGGPAAVEAYVMYNACDTLRNLPELIERGLKERGRSAPVFGLHVPADHLDDDFAFSRLDDSLSGLMYFLEERFETAFTHDGFEYSVERYDKMRELAREVMAMAAEGKLPFADCALAVQSNWSVGLEAQTRALGELRSKGARRSPDESGAPIMVTGIALPSALAGGVIEETGLRVVANDLATAGRSVAYSPPITDRPREYYRDFYGNHFPCTALLNTAGRRIDALVELARNSGARGVVFLGEKFCEYEYLEWPEVQKRLETEGLRALALEFAAEGGGQGSVKTRLEAFAELVRG